ncbi:MAG: prolyl oligopeptidase family serine peptidase [Sedimentisphaerales bacterium]|nr:prolyl oligopeptidase family serine peptidase [Sedimentisphaerales bacterium]
MKKSSFVIIFRWLFVLYFIINVSFANADMQKKKLQFLKTDANVRFGIWGKKPDKPAPTLFILSATIEESLGDSYFRQCGNILADKGYLCVSLDLPCHGLEKKPHEPSNLAGWRNRIEHNKPFIAEFNARAVDVLNYLVTEGYTNSEKVAVCGTSRGGFLALHFAAIEPRIKCVAAFAPVVDLGTLRDFKGLEQRPNVLSLGLTNIADKLVGRDIWLVIGDQDTAVDTDKVIGFARKVSDLSCKKSRIELHVMPEPRGHTTPAGAAEQAAIWIDKRLAHSKK